MKNNSNSTQVFHIGGGGGGGKNKRKTTSPNLANFIEEKGEAHSTHKSFMCEG